MSVLVLSSWLAAAAAAAAPAPGTPQKGLPLQRKEDCLNTATFDAFLSAGADSWGLEEGKAKDGVELLEAAVQCRALASRTEEPCRQLGLVPRFAAAKQLAANCRSEHHLLAFYQATAEKRMQSATQACESWYEVNKDQLLPKVKGPELCGRLSALLQADPSSACRKLGADLSQAAGLPSERGAIESTCAAVWTPDKGTCARADALPFEKKRCEDYGRLRAALASRKAADCPKSPRYKALCQAMLDKDANQACDGARKAWQELLCAGRFQER